MTLEQLRMLKTVKEQGSLKAASEKMFKTQAAISQGIKQLESHLEIELFDRKGYRLILTVEGERIYQLALTLLEKADEIESLSHHFNIGNESRVTLAFSGSFDLKKVLGVLEEMQEKFPETQIIIRQEQITGAIDTLYHGEADIVITPVTDMILNQKQLETFLLCKGASMMVAAPKLLSRHPELKSVKELEKEYQIIIQDSGTRTKGITFGVEDGQRRWFVNDLSTKKILTLSGMGWGGFPLHIIDDELKKGTLKKIHLMDSKTEFEIHYYVVKQRSQILGPVASQLWESLNSLREYESSFRER